MGGNPEKEPPFFFYQPFDAIVPVRPPAWATSATRGHEGLSPRSSWVVAMAPSASRSRPSICAVARLRLSVGLDMTRRDLQGRRKRPAPWDYGKSFAQSAPIGESTAPPMSAI